VDVNGEVVNPNVSHAVSEESLDAWPSLIHASTSVLQAEDSNIRFMLWASFAEIYNEQIFDLLDSATVSTARASRPQTLQLRDGNDGRPYIRGLREVHVCSVEEAWKLVQIGRENQHIASTRLNRASSRSHSIFTLRLIQVVDVDQPSVARVASLSFCDLAGSERNTVSGGCNERIKEAGNINLSLMTLGRCVEALRKNQARVDQSTTTRASGVVVPFRNSKLTRLFQSFLCGEGRVIMITNVSPCANVFDETLHAVNYSAIASQVIVGPSGPPSVQSTSILTMPPAPADKRKGSLLGKHEASAAAAKIIAEKKLKTCDDTILEEEEEDACSSDEDAPNSWKDERQKLLSAVQKLRDALTEERKSKHAIRAEVCEEMQRQLVRIENEYQESTRRHEEILEEKYERKMEIYMEAVQKSCKRQRRADDDDDYVPSVELHAAEVKLSSYAHEVSKLKDKISEMGREMAAARENIGKLAVERDEVAEKLTKAEFSASEAVRQEKTQARVECTKLRKTIEELTSKLNEAEHRHEVSCRQLRRDKAQLEQRLKELVTPVANQDPPQTAGAVSDELDKNAPTAKVAELEATLKKELEQRLKLAQDDTNAVDTTWAQHCKEFEAVCQEKSYELTKLQQKYDVLESNMQETVKSLEEAKQNNAQTEEKLQAAQNDLQEKEKDLKDLTIVLESLRGEIKSLTVESENMQTDLLAKESECERLKTEISDLKQQDTVRDLEQRLKIAENDKKAVDDKWAQHCKEVEASYQEKFNELTKLQKKYDILERNMQVTVKSLEEAKQNDARTEEELQTAQNELQEKEKDLKDLTTVLESLRGEIKSLTVESENMQTDLLAKESECERLKTEFRDLKQQTSAAVSNGEDELREKASEILRLEKVLEVERAIRCQFEATATDCEKKLDEVRSSLCQEQEKCSTLQSSLESLQSELDTAKDACRAAEDKIESHLSSIVSHEAKLDKAEEQLNVMEETLQKANDHEKALEQQLSSLSQLVNELQEKDRSQAVELADRDKKLQSLQTAVSDLKQKSEEDRLKLDLALKDAHSNEEVIEQMKLTITEQEMTMQTQDQTLRERDGQVRSLEEQLEKVTAGNRDQSESLNDQIRQKSIRIRDLEKEVEKVRKSRECLEKDVRDTTFELKTSESNLAEAKKNLAQTKQELEKLKSEESNAKSLEKQLYQREMELANLRKQLEVAQEKIDQRVQEMKMLNTQFHALKIDKEKELSNWREERDRLVAKLEKSLSQKDAEIQSLKDGSRRHDRQPSSEDTDRKVEALQKKIEQLSRTASVNDQVVSDLREQNRQLEHQLRQLHHHSNVDDDDRDNHQRRRNAPRKSRIPTSQRMPLSAADGNADVSVGVLADGGIAIDLDETVGPSKRSTRRRHVSNENMQPKTSDVIDEQHARASRSRHKRTTGMADTAEPAIAEGPEGPSYTRRLRSRHC